MLNIGPFEKTWKNPHFWFAIQLFQVWLWMLSLSIHMKMHEKIHTFDKPFSCSQCDYKCSTLDNLKRHEKIRAVDKPFRCSQCDYKCSTLGHLKRHEKILTGDKPFSCSQFDYKCSPLAIWKDMKKSTLLIRHSIVPSVTINALTINPFEDAWKNPHFW